MSQHHEQSPPLSTTTVSAMVPTRAELWTGHHHAPGATTAFAHQGLTITNAGDLLTFHAGHLVTMSGSGEFLRAIETPLIEGHGLTITCVDGTESVWIADPGFANGCISGPSDDGVPTDFGAGLSLLRSPGRVVRLNLDGTIVAELPAPPTVDDVPGPFGPFAPTSVAVDEIALGGSGDIWVADGYGSFTVHRYSATGEHLQTLTGAEGAGRFDCPHAVFIRRRLDAEPELYVADRGHARVAVYDLNGGFKRIVGANVLNSPSAFVQWGELLVVVELSARLTLLDDADRHVGYIGEDDVATARPGWPNALDEAGTAVAPPLVAPGILNSPHSAVVTTDGALIVGEWLIGGRYTRFTRL